jgi:hypothetical protein
LVRLDDYDPLTLLFLRLCNSFFQCKEGAQEVDQGKNDKQPTSTTSNEEKSWRNSLNTLKQKLTSSVEASQQEQEHPDPKKKKLSNDQVRRLTVVRKSSKRLVFYELLQQQKIT